MKGHFLHIEGDHVFCRSFGCFFDGGAVGQTAARNNFLGDSEGAMGRGNQKGAIWCHETAHDRSARFHHFGGNQDIDITFGRCQRENRPRPGFRQHFYIIDGCSGTLCDARDRSGLNRVTIAFGQIDDPVAENAAALPANRQNRQFNDLVDTDIRITRIQYRRILVHSAGSIVSTQTNRFEDRRFCNQVTIFWLRWAHQVSSPVGL